MITVNDRSLCEYCFFETEAAVCPNCGYDKRSYRDDPIALRIGSMLCKRYLIGGVIGKGGFGITYLAYDLKLDAKIAVKEYYPAGLAVRTPGTTAVTVSNRESEETFKNGAKQFYSEAKTVARFNGNINIVSVYDFFYENDTVYFTMGYLGGDTLKTYLKDHRITEGQAVRLMNDITGALMAVHSTNILHRDISPDNIMVCDDGNLKLIDFGAARCVIAEQSQSLSVILKQGFTPLEQYQKKGKQGPWTDIYALGATVYHALTGETLDDPISRLEDDHAVMGSDHGINEALWNIISKCIMIKADERYRDVFELRKDLNDLDISPEPFDKIKSAEVGVAAESVENATKPVVPAPAVNVGDNIAVPVESFPDAPPVIRSGKNILIPILITLFVFAVAILGVVVGIMISNRIKENDTPVASSEPAKEDLNTVTRGTEDLFAANDDVAAEHTTEDDDKDGDAKDTEDETGDDIEDDAATDPEPEEETPDTDDMTGNDNAEFGLDGSESPRYQAVIYDYEYGHYTSDIPLFDFMYPRYLYSEVKEKSGTVDNNDYTDVLFTRSDGSRLDYYTTEYTGKSVSEQTQGLYISCCKDLVESVDIIPAKISDGDGIFIVTGRQKENHNNLVYLLMRITTGRYYEMRIVFPDYENANDEDWKSYYAEYLYRSVGFTNSSKPVRTFEEYMNAK